MDTFTAVMLAENGPQDDEDPSEYIAAWQHLIDTGLCWQLQGFFGRMAKRLIEDGVCHQ